MSHEMAFWLNGLLTGLALAVPVGLLLDRILDVLTRSVDDRGH